MTNYYELTLAGLRRGTPKTFDQRFDMKESARLRAEELYRKWTTATSSIELLAHKEVMRQSSIIDTLRAKVQHLIENNKNPNLMPRFNEELRLLNNKGT